MFKPIETKKLHEYLAVPLKDKHTGSYHSSDAMKVLDVDASWEPKLIGISSDGAAIIIAIFQGASTRIKSACSSETSVFYIKCI